MTTPNTRLAAYQGTSIGSLTLVEREDDESLADPRSRVVIDATSGQTFRIQLGDAPGQPAGPRILRWYASPPNPPQLCDTTGSFIANPSLEADASGWGLTAASAAAGDVFQRYLGDGVDGAACAEALIVAAAAGRGLLYTGTNLHDWSGRTTISVWLKAAAGTPAPLAFAASVNGTPLTPAAGSTPLFALTGAWQQISIDYAEASSLVGPLLFEITTQSGGAALVLRADCLTAVATSSPPPAPTNLACAPSTDQIRLTWDPVPGADGYIIRRGGAGLATTDVATFLDRFLAPNTLYTYSIAAFTRLGGESAAVPLLCATRPLLGRVDPSCEPLGFLEINGREVINRARCFAYLQAGLGGDRWILRGADCDILTREIGFTPRDPATDPAPWYDPQRPESGDFLGVFARIRVNRHHTRAVTPTIGGLGGAVIGQARPAPTTVDVTCELISRSSGGAYYGRTWLESALRAVSCDPCGLGTARLRLACPPDDGTADAQGEVFLYDVALAGDITDQDQQTDGCCGFQTLGFQLVAGQPNLYHRTSLCATGIVNPDPGTCIDICDWLFGPADGSFSSSIACPVANPNLFGAVGAIVTLSAETGQSAQNIEIDVHTAGTPCPPPVGATPRAKLTVPLLPAGGVLVIDSARELVTFYATGADAAAGANPQSGVPYIALAEGEGMAWITADPCTPAGCVVVGKREQCGGQVSVRIDTQLREA